MARSVRGLETACPAAAHGAKEGSHRVRDGPNTGVWQDAPARQMSLSFFWIVVGPHTGRTAVRPYAHKPTILTSALCLLTSHSFASFSTAWTIAMM